MTAAQPGAERVQGEVNQGIGWYEFITPKATTRIAHVGESGYLYLPEGDPEEHFHLASAEGRAHRLIRADGLDVEEMARELFVADSGQDRAFALGIWRTAPDDQAVKKHWRRIATALRTALLGGAA